MKTNNRTENSWKAPLIPPIPMVIAGTKQHELCLDGIWEFLPEICTEVPAPNAITQDFDFSSLAAKAWKQVIVPGELVMQGFSIKNNTEYYYRRGVDIPADFTGKRILIRFDGVYSNARVWLNGILIRTHCGGFTTWDCDITELARPGTSVLLTVGVADLEGSDQGNYNPGGIKRLGDPAWASFYAHHNIGGILRSVTLLALPEPHLARLHTAVEFDKTFTDAALTMDFELARGGESGIALLNYRLLDKNGLQILQDSAIFPAGESVCQVSGAVKAPDKWDAEHPNLYSLEVSLIIDGAACAVYRENLGFRQIQFAGQGGTACNKIYVNGKEVKLRGTCRHDVSFCLGRSTTREEDWAEIKAYKEANINHVRTSHYPASRHFLDACDAIGMYVEQENAACFQGENGYGIYCEPADFLNEFTEMIERDRNRACILIWSLGNESDFEKTPAFRQELEYIRREDSSRPVIFSYPFTVRSLPLPYDIFSRHYEDFYNPKGSQEIPVLHDEYMHISCYNIEELTRDPNVRNFWGEGLKRVWDEILKTDGALGGDLWGGIDDVFYLPYSSDELWQTHSPGKAAGYGQWGSVLDVHRRLKPEAYLTKKAYSPVRVDEKTVSVRQDDLLIPVENGFDHTNLEEIRLSWRIDQDAEWENMQLPRIAPHEKGLIQLQGNWNRAHTISLRFYDAAGLLLDEYLLKPNQKKSAAQSVVSCLPPNVRQTKTEIVIEGTDFLFLFDRNAATLRSAQYQDSLLLTGGPYLHITGMSLGAWKPLDCSCTLEKERVSVTLFGSYENGTQALFIIYIYGDGRMHTRCVIEAIQQESCVLDEVGISYRIPADVAAVSWNREGFYSCYPEDHIGRNTGTAYRRRPGAEQDSYTTQPSWPWKDDMRDDFLYAAHDLQNGLATRDFKAMRENILFYKVHFAGRTAAVQAESDGCAAARVQITAQSSGEESAYLIVNSRWSYPDLAWGNYTGTPITLIRGFAMEATLLFTPTN